MFGKCMQYSHGEEIGVARYTVEKFLSFNCNDPLTHTQEFL